MSLIDDIKRDREVGTPGPWAWEVSRHSLTVELCGGRGAHDLTVMSFARWGMSKAAPVFWFWKGNTSDEPKRADKIAVPEPGREHHSDWFQRIDHPDARRIARVPEMEAALLAAGKLADALEAYMRAGAGPLTGWIDVEEALAAYRKATEAAE